MLVGAFIVILGASTLRANGREAGRRDNPRFCTHCRLVPEGHTDNCIMR